MNGGRVRATGAEEIVRPRRLIRHFWGGPSTSPLDGVGESFSSPGS